MVLPDFMLIGCGLVLVALKNTAIAGQDSKTNSGFTCRLGQDGLG